MTFLGAGAGAAVAALLVGGLQLRAARRVDEARAAVHRSSGWAGSEGGRPWLAPLLVGGAAFALGVAVSVGRPEGSSAADGDGAIVVVLLDLSRSMSVMESGRSRFDRARMAARRAVADLPHARLGLIGFTATAHVLVPPTLDRRTIDLYLDALSPGMASPPGSRGAPAIRRGRRLLSEVAGADPSSSPYPLLLLLSDGELHDESREVAREIRALRREGGILATVTLGREEGGPVPLAGGGDSESSRPQSRARPDRMRRFAELGGGAALAGERSLARALPSLLAGGRPPTAVGRSTEPSDGAASSVRAEGADAASMVGAAMALALLLFARAAEWREVRQGRRQDR